MLHRNIFVDIARVGAIYTSCCTAQLIAAEAWEGFVAITGQTD